MCHLYVLSMFSFSGGKLTVGKFETGVNSHSQTASANSPKGILGGTGMLLILASVVSE